MRKSFPGRFIQTIIDAHEQEMEVPSDPMARRSTWSSYKHRNTGKFIGEISANGAAVAAQGPWGGNTGDRSATRSANVLKRARKGNSSLADKGFMMHADYAEVLHELITPPKAYHGQLSFTVDETLLTSAVARERALVERVFERAQNWKILHNIIKISECDLAGSVFFVCMMMTNYEPPIVRKGLGLTHLITMSELQWGK
jgi:hypothetical protein